MKITIIQLKEIIMEELESAMSEQTSHISAAPIETQIGRRSVANKALEIIKQQGSVGYIELEKWLFQNHNVGDDDWLSEVIEAALNSNRLTKYYDEETHSFRTQTQKGLAGSSYEDTAAAYKKNPEAFNENEKFGKVRTRDVRRSMAQDIKQKVAARVDDQERGLIQTLQSQLSRAAQTGTITSGRVLDLAQKLSQELQKIISK